MDSAVAAALVHRAVGDQLTCVFIDHGFLRQGEREQVEEDFARATGIQVRTVDARKRFLDELAALPDPTDPEAKRKTIGRVFIREFEAAAREIAEEQGHDGAIEFLVQGTLYPDVVESGGGEGAAKIKSHHNVGGLPPDLAFQLIEPLRRLFKDEVRAVGHQLGLPGRARMAAAFPRSRFGGAHHRRGHRRPAGHPASRRRHRTGGADSRRARPGDLAVSSGPARRRPQRGVQGDGRTYGHPLCCVRSAARTP